MPEDKPNPLNFYGETKAAGEDAITAHSGGKGLILRVPVLFVPVPAYPRAARTRD